MQRFLFLLLLFCSSCCQQRFIVRNEYLTIDRYASFHIGTPDPRLECPELGQMLTVYWNITDLFYREAASFSLQLTIRFGNLEQITLSTPIQKARGSYQFRLTDCDYWDKEGILAYKIELLSDNQIIDVWRHQLWVELIEFNSTN